jgi:hypothetical protein
VRAGLVPALILLCASCGRRFVTLCILRRRRRFAPHGSLSSLPVGRADGAVYMLVSIDFLNTFFTIGFGSNSFTIIFADA